MTTTVTVCLPPEACGCISIAQRHLDTAKRHYRYSRRWRDTVRHRKHMEKVQKLIAKSSRLIPNLAALDGIS